LKQAVPSSRYLVFFALALGVCAIDLVTKTRMFDWLGMPDPHREPWWIWKDVVGFQTTLNEGALFGLGPGLWPLFAALSVGAAVGILVWLFAAGAARDWLLTVALALVTAGILGNFYDRLGLPGFVWPTGDPFHHAGAPVHAVRDFILVMIGPWQWPNFNLADSSLVCGAALLAWHAMFSRGEGTAKNGEGRVESGEEREERREGE
jgi:signal peptidase II